MLSSQVSHRLTTTRDLGVALARRGRGFLPNPKCRASKQESVCVCVRVRACVRACACVNKTTSGNGDTISGHHDGAAALTCEPS